MPDIFPLIPGVEPDGLVRVSLPDLLHQLPHRQPVGRVQRISAGKGDPGDVGLLQLTKQLLPGLLVKQYAAVRIPRDRIMAILTAVGTAGHPEHHAQAIAV